MAEWVKEFAMAQSSEGHIEERIDSYKVFSDLHISSLAYVPPYRQTDRQTDRTGQDRTGQTDK